MNLVGWTAKRPLAAVAIFWILAGALTWLAYGLATRGGGDGALALLNNPWALVAKFSPSLVGLALVVMGGRAVRAPFLAAAGRMGNPWVLLAAVVLPGLITFASLAVAAVTNGQDPGVLVSHFALPTAAYWLAVRMFLGGGVGEELGIRGVTLPLLLQRMGPRCAALVTGVFWAAWHLPALVSKPPIVWLAQLVLTVSASLILTFVWMRFKPSLVVAVVIHGAMNGWAAYAGNGWAPMLADIEIWQVIRLLTLLGFALALLPFRWQPRSLEKGP